MKKTHFSKLALLGALLLLVTTTLVGCGGSGGGKSDSGKKFINIATGGKGA